jgi:transposase-like protein
MSGRPSTTAEQKKAMKAKICEILEKLPIIESACQKVGISRMTLSRWRKKDKKFSKKIDEVLEISRESVSDLAESKMMQKIDEGNPSMIRFWLCHNSSRYKKKHKKEEEFTEQIIKFAVPPSPFMTGGLKKKSPPK